VKNYAFPYALPFAFPQAKKDEEEDTMLAMMKKLFMKKMFKKLMEKHADVLDEGDDKDEKLSRKVVLPIFFQIAKIDATSFSQLWFSRM